MVQRILCAAAIAASLAGASCSRSDTSNPPTPTPIKPSKDPAKARELIASGALVLDVRTPDEYREAHLPTATNLPIDEVGARLADVDQLAHGDKTKPIVVYCAAGGRAARAKQTLEAAGYTNIVNGGGLDDLR